MRYPETDMNAEPAAIPQRIRLAQRSIDFQSLLDQNKQQPASLPRTRTDSEQFKRSLDRVKDKLKKTNEEPQTSTKRVQIWEPHNKFQNLRWSQQLAPLEPFYASSGINSNKVINKKINIKLPTSSPDQGRRSEV